MKKRALVPLALLVLAAATVTACGGGESDEDKIVGVIETAETTTDPGNCKELQTQRFNDQVTQQSGKAGTKACEKEAKEGEAQAKSVKVSNVSVDDAKATAEVEFKGGPLIPRPSKSPWSKRTATGSSTTSKASPTTTARRSARRSKRASKKRRKV